VGAAGFATTTRRRLWIPKASFVRGRGRTRPVARNRLGRCRLSATGLGGILKVDPVRTVVFETTADGVDAGRAGGFEMVVAVGRERTPPPRGHRADLVVADLSEPLERQLAP
jgi:beta-phosphoglucomutase-like phosphatase (HAD superfamily)